MTKPLGTCCVKNCCLAFLLLLQANVLLAQDFRRYQQTGQLRSDEYLMKSFNEHHDPIFDNHPQVVDLGLNLGIGSDCGRVNFEGTMKSTLKNLLDSKYYGDIGKNIIAASPMLLTCYMSPTWCAILKHTQVNANFLSQMRLDQCALVDKYTDSRTDDYYRERQNCVRQKIADNGGDLENAMGSCQNVYNADLKNWAGSSSGDKTPTNKLIESSAKWAGLTGPDADRSTDLVKAFVGDTVLSQGNVSVEYGTRQKALTPELHLKELQDGMHKNLCDGILVRVAQGGGTKTVDQLVTDSELKALNPSAAPDSTPLIDRQTVEALAFMPYRQQHAACKRLADTMALTVFTKDVNRSVDILALATQNPNLPPERKAEVEEKRRRLKESVDLTLELERQRNDPLRNVLRDINAQGEGYRDHYTAEALQDDENAIRTNQTRQVFVDCGDGLMCGNGGSPCFLAQHTKPSLNISALNYTRGLSMY